MSSVGSMERETSITDEQPYEQMVKDGEGEEEKSRTVEHVETKRSVNDSKDETSLPIGKDIQDRERCLVVEAPPMGTNPENDQEKRIEEDIKNPPHFTVPIEEKGVEEVTDEKNASQHIGKAHGDEKCEELQAENGKKQEEIKDSDNKAEDQKKEECKHEALMVTDAFENTETSKRLAEKEDEKRIEGEEVMNYSSEVPASSEGSAHDKDPKVDNGKKELEEEQQQSTDLSRFEVLGSRSKHLEQQKEEGKVEALSGTDAVQSTGDHEKRIEERRTNTDSGKCDELQTGNEKKEEQKEEIRDPTIKFEKEKSDLEISETVANESDEKEEDKKVMASAEVVKSREGQSNSSCSQAVMVTKHEEERVKSLSSVAESGEDCKDSTFATLVAENDHTKEEHEVEKHHVHGIGKSKEEASIPQEKSVSVEIKDPEISERSVNFLCKEIVHKGNCPQEEFASHVSTASSESKKVRVLMEENVQTLDEGSGLTAETGTKESETQATGSDSIDSRKVVGCAVKINSTCEDKKKEESGKLTQPQEEDVVEAFPTFAENNKVCKDSTSAILVGENSTKEKITVISTKEEHEAEVLEEKHPFHLPEKRKEEVDLPQGNSVSAEVKEPELSEKSVKVPVQEIVNRGRLEDESCEIQEERESKSSDVSSCHTGASFERKKVRVLTEEKIKPFVEGTELTAKTVTKESEIQATVTASIGPKDVEGCSIKISSTCEDDTKKEESRKFTFAEELLKEEIAEGKISSTASVTELVHELVEAEDQTEALAKEVLHNCPQLPNPEIHEVEEKRTETSNPQHVEKHEEEHKGGGKEMKGEHKSKHVTVKTDEGDHVEHHSFAKHEHHSIMWNVKHSISKVKKKILGKTSSSKSMSSDNQEEH